MSEEAYPEAAAILAQAGWKPHDAWNVYTRDTLVMGFQPDGLGFHVKNWAKVQPGDRSYSEDTPDTPEEAAAWLVARFKAPDPEANPLALDSLQFGMPSHLSADQWVAQEQEAEETLQDESNGETGEAFGVGESAPELVLEPGSEGRLGGSDLQTATALSDDALGSSDGADDEPGHEGTANLQERGPDSDGFVDADFTIEDLGHEAEQLEGPIEDFAPDEFAPEEDQSGAFIFGDNLHQMRTAAIGLVVQAAIERLPAGIDYARLAELRNFVMGVSEGRWADDTTKRDELDTLEATERKRRAVEAVRDDKVSFLVGASREEIEDFAVDAGWPE